MIHRSSYKSDVNHAVQITRVILGLIGAWPPSDTSTRTARITRRVLNFASYFLFLFILVPGLLRVFLKERLTAVRLKMIGPIMNCAFGMAKYSLLLYRAKEIRRALRKVGDDWKRLTDAEDRRIMLLKVKVARALVVCSASFMYGGGLSYRTIIPLSRGAIVTADNVTVRSLACPSYFVVFNEQISPAYEIVFALQFLAGFLVYSVTCGTCGLSAFLVLHLCGQLRLLINEMNGLLDGPQLQQEMVKRRIGSIIEHQIEARDFLKQIENIIEYMCLVEIAGCTLSTCLSGYYVLKEWEKSDTTAMVTYFVITVSFIFSMFLFCYIGQLLDDERMAVGLASITIDWYYLPVRQARCLLLIIVMSNYPLRLTAGKIIYMSLSSFTAIMKTCMGYFNILRTMIP